ncbi:DUF2971 domain-containing protein [Rhizobium sp. CG4]|uniref:DUF2971 domain-containing protein n=1 Tax=Rhizobium sp. CG4 TaxID=2726075 RepID=UPI002033F511|nr:DUF2971 domain-containing protein [Rhizobium sp. CG4]MCM2455282.1 DUF2971 domain-containing protein [Rhizobium sp. CG4]
MALASLYSNQKLNKIFSHYTSLDGFLNIIRESQIRASNILFLNDKEEMEYGIKIAKEVLAEFDKEEGRKRSSRSLKVQMEIPDVYACCFCEEQDMLSQWRGYGAASQGVSIQFDADALATLAKSHNFQLVTVKYGKKDAMSVLRERLQGAETTASIIRSLIELKNEEDYTADDVRRNMVLNLAPEFKNDAFKEECEWRIVATANVVKQVHYRTRDNVIIPYVNIGNSNARLPITRVTVGPGKDSNLTRKSIEKFLSSNLFYNNVDVGVSSIPFRT